MDWRVASSTQFFFSNLQHGANVFLSGKHVNAEPLYQWAVRLWELWGEYHPNFPLAMCELARIYYMWEEYTGTEPLLERAINLWEQQGVKPFSIIFVMLAEIYYAQKKYKAAVDLYRRNLLAGVAAIPLPKPDKDCNDSC